MLYAIDWGHKTDSLVIVDDKLNIIKDLEPQVDDTLLIETGFPKAKFLKKCKNIYVVSGKETKKYNKVGKTHLKDAKTIMKLYKEKPKLFKKFTERNIEELMLLQEFKLYEQMTKDIARMKNINFAYKNEYGKDSEHYLIAITELEKAKKEQMKKIEKQFKPDTEKFSDINGVGPRYLCGILLYAHPRKFPFLSGFLMYSGCKDKAFWKTVNGKKKKAGNYNHNVKMMLNQMAQSIIRGKDKKFYNFYLEVKAKFAKDHSDWTKGHINGVAINQLSTFIAKEIYWRCKGT